VRPYNCKVGFEVNEFVVVEDLGRRFPTESSKSKAVFVVVECKLCKDRLEGQLTHFKYGARKCLKCFPKKWKVQKNYEGLIHGDFEIIKDHMIRNGQARKVIGQCTKCLNEYEHNYFSFKQEKIICECKFSLERTEDWIRIRKIYLGMVYRCHDKNAQSYHNYGERGIKVCEEWRSDKRKFYEWSISNGYESHLTIDRIDNDLGYSPNNCRWATTLEQGRNKRDIMGVETAKEIKRLLNDGFTHNKIAEMTKTSHHAVSCISKGASWSDINLGD